MKKFTEWLSISATLKFKFPILGGQNCIQLDPLFDALKLAKSGDEAEIIEGKIWDLWSISGDEEIDSLMAVGVQAMLARDGDTALAAFDEIIKRAPGFAEGWNKRATLFYLAGEHHRSKADAKKTLELEPRHFGALSGLGLIHLAQGKEEMALEAFEKAILIHPFIAGADSQIQDLRKRLRSHPV